MINDVTLLGRVGNDPDIKRLENNLIVANFSFATSRKWKDKSGETKELTQWHRIVIWGKLAEIVEKYVKKGSLLFLKGEIQYREYEKKEGGKGYITEIYCSSIKILDHREGDVSDRARQQAAQIESMSTGASSNNDYSEPNDDLPF